MITSILTNDIKFSMLSKVIPLQGNMAWEYNPFRNYRLSENKYYFREKFLTENELIEELLGKKNEYNIKLSKENTTWETFYQNASMEIEVEIDEKSETKTEVFKNGIKWKCVEEDENGNCIKKEPDESEPILYEKDSIVDFDTDELEFDVNNPVNILPQYSYDGSVNLIINDGKNKPRLINSRFSALGRNKYLIVDRKGDNDTNIYDLGSLFESDTSLYKTYVGIPTLEFINVYLNGSLAVGNYHFYFRYLDADGNETDFVAESGLVSIFKGVTPDSVNSGFRDENSLKSVKFLLYNIDPAYQYINIYYTRSTSDIYENSTTVAYKIDLKYLVNNTQTCSILITGQEPVIEVTVDDINPMYQIAENVQTQDTCLNMLFFGNIENYNIAYKELADLSLRWLPSINTLQEYKNIGSTYENDIKNTYYDPKFIYNKTGYLNNELYRFGVVYILNNGLLTPVFNIRGGFFDDGSTCSTIGVYDTETGERNYIKYNEENGIIQNDEKTEYISYENVYGVVKVNLKDGSEFNKVIGIDIKCSDDIISELKKYKIKGYFFVRQTRIPLRISQAFTFGIDKESHTPLLWTNAFNNEEEYITERFINDNKEIQHQFKNRLYSIKNKNFVTSFGAICPDYDVNGPYLNNLFCGNEYLIERLNDQSSLQIESGEDRHFNLRVPESLKSEFLISKIVGVEDNVKLIECNNKLFSARAGEAEEAYRYEYIEKENKITNATNLLRGSFGPYLALGTYSYPGTMINIYHKDYLDMSKEELLKIRINDKSPYFAISERYSIESINHNHTLYRGDSYICMFTHRLNRNFSDPSAPINDKIVDPNCWKDNYEVTDGVVNIEKFENINLGDVNAVLLGMWVTFPVVSNYNLNIRPIDETIPDEIAMFGHPRGFYPYHAINAGGSYKLPEALCFNKGFNKSVSERYNFELPDVPSIKNDFTNRISYSDVHVNDAFKNGFRTFRGLNYRDYPKTYGLITKIIEVGGALLVVFEHGVGLIAVNERTVAGQGAGGTVYINTSNVLPENPKILSDKFGSQWRESVIKTPTGIYGVDTVAKKIWRTDGSTFECISDFKIQEFLNKNISLTEREIDPVIGIRNVKTHYNAFKRDIMFTFYDNLYGFEEKVWNLCYNELLQKWITFYSWVPSYSENIFNLYFSFDRNTSKWITKLGVSKKDNHFTDGIVLSDNIISNDAGPGDIIGELSLANRTLPEGDNIDVKITYELERDDRLNYKKFKIITGSDKDGIIHSYLCLKPNSAENKKDGVFATDLCSEQFERGNRIETKDEETNNYKVKYVGKINDLSDSKQFRDWQFNIVENNYVITKDDNGRRRNLKEPYNMENVVTLLNIKANITVIHKDNIPSLNEALSQGFINGTQVDAGYYQSTIAVIPKYNMLFLTTDFWKHGQAGIVDIADKIYPTYWYGKQHPFEFEFIVNVNPSMHKIFDNLEIISNNAEPESFHYEIIGDCFDFAKDKKNMYIRQEATKEFYQYNGSDITYDKKYINLTAIHRQLNNTYDKSTILPIYYLRKDTLNEIEDAYLLKDGQNIKDYSNRAGAEIVHYEILDEYRIWNHAKAIDLNDKGRLRGNMQYLEDKWLIQINPINIIEHNEKRWDLEDLTYRKVSSNKIPIELKQSPDESLINNIKDKNIDFNNIENYPDNSKDRSLVIWSWENQKEVKMKDKWIKIRIRYKGDKLAIITAIKTLYSLSYA